MLIPNLRLTLTPTDGNGQPPVDDASSDSQPSATDTKHFSAPLPQPPPPPAAAIVIAGKKTESDVAPALDAKKLQNRIAQLEDERRRLLEAQSQPAPSVVQALAEKKSWLQGGSFFD